MNPHGMTALLTDELLSIRLNYLPASREPKAGDWNAQAWLNAEQIRHPFPTHTLCSKSLPLCFKPWR